MKIGSGIDTSVPIDSVVAQARGLAEAGMKSLACSQIFSYDAITLLSLVGAQVPEIELMTAVVPTYPRHPIVMAAQAATGGRFTLGIGLSHQVVIENMYGFSFDRPARHMRDYLNALMPLLRGEQVSYQGETPKGRHHGSTGDQGPASAGAGGRSGPPHAGAGRHAGRRDHHLDDRPGHHRFQHRSQH